MRRQTILWTVLPNGVENGMLKFSVLVSPRLVSDHMEGAATPRLDTFPDFLDWPATVSSIRFALLASGNRVVAKALRPLGEAERSSDLWRAVFPKSLTVESHVFRDYSVRPIRSYSVEQLEQSIGPRYIALAVSAEPNQATSRGTILDKQDASGKSFASLVVSEGQKEAMRSVIDSALQGGPGDWARASDPGDPFSFGKDPWMLAQADGFHRERSDRQLPRPELETPVLDFHSLVGSMGQYPALMRRLGLLLDFEAPAAALGGQWGSEVWVLPQWRPLLLAEVVDHSPHTLLDGVAGSFRAITAGGSEISDRMLRLDKDAALYYTSQLDAGATALRVMDFGAYLEERTVNGVENFVAPAAPCRAQEKDGKPLVGAPALRTHGIGVSRNGLAAKLRFELARAKAINQAIEQGQSGMVLLAEDLVRGYRIDVSEKGPGGWGPWLSLCRRQGVFEFPLIKDKWTAPEHEGWISFAATEPINPVKTADGNQPELRAHETLFQWDGWSLSVPRPGKAVRPDGTIGEGSEPDPRQNYLRATFTVPKGSLPKLRFGRTYRLRARTVDLAGNSLLPGGIGDVQQATPEIRFGRMEPVNAPHLALVRPLTPPRGESVDCLVIRSRFDGNGNLVGTESAERHIVAPRAAPRMAEWHGIFDAAGGGVDPTAYDLIAQREGELNEVYPGAQVTLPYLADPIARGAALAGLPGSAGKIVRVDFRTAESRWFDPRSFRMRLLPGRTNSTGSHALDPATRVLSVVLPPGESTEIDVSCYLEERHLDQMAVWHWIEEQVKDEAGRKRLRELAVQGCHWMLTPCRRVGLVHAVQQPALPPSFASQMTVKREAGFTSADIVASQPTSIHGPSTERVDVTAFWEDPIDDPRLNRFDRLPTQAHAFTVPAKLGETIDPSANSRRIEGRQEFGDTKRRRVILQAVATTRFREYFPDLPDSPGNFTRASAPSKPLDIPSSAPPNSPDVLYVVPTFAWTEQKDRNNQNQVTHVRQGNGVRVYMNRGWFSSGEGEMLGVVLPQPKPIQPGEISSTVDRQSLPAFPVDESLRPFVTQWGVDPVWNVGPSPGPSYADVRRAFVKATPGPVLPLRESADNPSPFLRAVTVAAYEVQLDEQRNLLYCDIDIDLSAYYMPFVRLALARYQPNSVEGMHLSHVVLADFVQLSPTRTVSLVRSGGQLSVSVSGILQASKLDDLKQSARVEVALEEPVVAGMSADEELGWRPLSSGTPGQDVVPTPLTPTKGNQGGLFWTGTVSLPARRPLRLVVREYETYEQPRSPVREGNRPTERLIFADAILINQ